MSNFAAVDASNENARAAQTGPGVTIVDSAGRVDIALKKLRAPPARHNATRLRLHNKPEMFAPTDWIRFVLMTEQTIK